MTDLEKLSTLLDSPEVQVLVFGLAHVAPGVPSGDPGAPELRMMLARLADVTEAEQFNSWLSDDAGNHRITVDQVRAAYGPEMINDLARYVQSSPVDVETQLVAVLPDLVDAVSPGGSVIDANELAQQLNAASAADDRSSGAFGPRIY
jgi:uncharacterized protein YidB (DUF937 family)